MKNEVESIVDMVAPQQEAVDALHDKIVENIELTSKPLVTVFEDEIDLIVWDLETSGFNAPECKILEIGCFIVRGKEVERKHWVLDNKIEIPERIVEITGITQAIIDAEGRDPKECLSEFLPLFKEAKKNITHNGVRFDIPFLVNYSADLFNYRDQEKMAVTNLLRSTAFDTAVHFKAHKLDMQPFFRESFVQFADRVMNVRALGVKYSLGLCVEEMGIKHELTQHRAMADVELTYEIFKALRAEESHKASLAWFESLPDNK